MKIKTGIDLVYLPRFRKVMKNGGENFLRRVYLESELNHLGGGLRHLRGEINHLAAIFAAKEAVMKAFSLPPDSWHDIQITYKGSGAPKLEIRNLKLEIRNYSISISHDGNYVIAQFVAILDE